MRAYSIFVNNALLDIATFLEIWRPTFWTWIRSLHLCSSQPASWNETSNLDLSPLPLSSTCVLWSGRVTKLPITAKRATISKLVYSIHYQATTWHIQSLKAINENWVTYLSIFSTPICIKIMLYSRNNPANSTQSSHNGRKLWALLHTGYMKHAVLASQYGREVWELQSTIWKIALEIQVYPCPWS